MQTMRGAAFVLPFLLICPARAADLVLTGKVRQQFTGVPVAGATVRVFGTFEREVIERTASTGLDGGFSFDLPPGEYAAVASADGFDAERQSRILLAAGAKPPVLDLSLMGLGAITGRILDSQTKLPFAGVSIQAFLLTYAKGQRQRWPARNPILTGEDGAFAIEKLPAGEYVIEIEPPQNRKTGEDGNITGYARQVWPGPIQAASPLVLQPGAEYALGSIAVDRTVLSAVDITLTGDCAPDRKNRVAIYEWDSASPLQRGTIQNVCGESTRLVLPPGDYEFTARSQDSALNWNALSAGSVSVMVHSGMQKTQLPVVAPLLVTGSIGLADSDTQRSTLEKVVIRLVPLQQESGRRISTLPTAAPAPVWPDRSFQTRVFLSSGGVLQLQISGLPSGHYVKQIVYNGVSTHAIFQVNATAALPHLRVILSSQAAAVAGIVKDDHGRPVPGAAVVLSPWPVTLDAGYPSDLLEVRANAAGAFTFDTVKPGEYRLLAIPSAFRQRYEEPNRFANAFAAASTFVLKEREIFTREIVVAGFPQ